MLQRDCLHEHWQSWLCAGVYQCVKAYGRSGLTFSMRTVLTKCPASFTESGEQLICSSPINGPPSSQRYDHCTAEGTCTCKDPWKKPEGSTYTGEILCSTLILFSNAFLQFVGLQTHQELPSYHWLLTFLINHCASISRHHVC